MPEIRTISNILETFQVSERETLIPVSEIPVALSREQLTQLAKNQNLEHLEKLNTSLSSIQKRLDELNRNFGVILSYFSAILSGDQNITFTTPVGNLLSKTSIDVEDVKIIYLLFRHFYSSIQLTHSTIFNLRNENYILLDSLISQLNPDTPINDLSEIVSNANLSEFTIRDFQAAMRELLDVNPAELNTEPFSSFIELFLSQTAKQIIHRS